MATLKLTRDALNAAGRTLAGKGPVQMVNLVRFREQADYGDRTDFSPCSGREAYYSRYVQAFAEAAGDEKFSVTWLGAVLAGLVGPVGETWDDMVIVEYPSFETLRRIVESPEYATKAAPHRLAALEDWRFFATSKVDLPSHPGDQARGG